MRFLIVALFAITTTTAAQQQGYCDRAYALPDAKAMEQAALFDEKGSRLWVLSYNLVHDGEHYGNLVTCFRIKGIMPPSSRAQ